MSTNYKGVDPLARVSSGDRIYTRGHQAEEKRRRMWEPACSCTKSSSSRRSNNKRCDCLCSSLHTHTYTLSKAWPLITSTPTLIEREKKRSVIRERPPLESFVHLSLSSSFFFSFFFFLFLLTHSASTHPTCNSEWRNLSHNKRLAFFLKKNPRFI